MDLQTSGLDGGWMWDRVGLDMNSIPEQQDRGTVSKPAKHTIRDLAMVILRNHCAFREMACTAAGGGGRIILPAYLAGDWSAAGGGGGSG